MFQSEMKVSSLLLNMIRIIDNLSLWKSKTEGVQGVFCFFASSVVLLVLLQEASKTTTASR